MAAEDIKLTVARLVQDSLGKQISYFRNRWEDEKEYEDFAEYESALCKAFDKLVLEHPKLQQNWVKFVGLKKKPFSVRYSFGVAAKVFVIKTKLTNSRIELWTEIEE